MGRVHSIILYNPFHLVDLNQSQAADFEQYRRLDYLATAINCYRDFETNSARFAKIMVEMLGLGEFEYSETGLTYVSDGAKVLSHEEILLKLEQSLTTDERCVMESFSEHFASKGRQEGRQEMVISMLNNGATIDFIVKYSGLSRESIEELCIKSKCSSDH